MKLSLPLRQTNYSASKPSSADLRLFIISIFLILMSTLGATGYAQSVTELDEAIQTMQASGDPSVVQRGNQLQSLVYDLHPTLFLREGNFSNPLGGVPVCLNTDITSLWKLYETNPQLNQVELLIVMMEEPSALSATLNVGSFESFSSLSYIVFMSKFQVCIPPDSGCEAQAISQMITGGEGSGFQLFYKISISN